MQRKLSRWATEDKERKFIDLYSLLCNEIWLRVAHKNVSSNAGRETAGIDGQTMSDLNGNLDRHLGELKDDLKARIFEPLPVARAYVPKPNGKLRPLGIPGMKDRIVQEALRMALEPIWEEDFSIHSYGFRPLWRSVGVRLSCQTFLLDTTVYS
jgi:retron-type reverse transcriptase